jgi:hypothetical protein
MRAVVSLEIPARSVEKLMDGYRRGDPELLTLLQEWGVQAISAHDEQALLLWENEGGR